MESSSVLGGTISEIGGGKFANGVVTGAYSMLFNEMIHEAFTDRQLKKIYDAYSKPYEYGGISRENLYDEIGGDVLDIYLEYKDKEGYVESMENTCAIRLSRALNYSGFSRASGHLDIIYRRQAANHVYDKRNITTYYWH